MTDPDLRLRAVVPAPPKVVYEALTDPAALRVWLAEHADAWPDLTRAFTEATRAEIDLERPKDAELRGHTGTGYPCVKAI